MSPTADNCKVLLSKKDDYNFGSQDKDKTSSGILSEIPKELKYIGFHSFAFEASLGNKEALRDVLYFYSDLIGKRVFWSSGKQLGSVFEDDDNTYAFIKLTDILAFAEPDTKAINITDRSSGAVSI